MAVTWIQRDPLSGLVQGCTHRDAQRDSETQGSEFCGGGAESGVEVAQHGPVGAHLDDPDARAVLEAAEPGSEVSRQSLLAAPAGRAYLLLDAAVGDLG